MDGHVERQDVELERTDQVPGDPSAHVQPPRGRHGSQRIPELGFDRADAGLRESRFVDDHEGVDADLRQATHLPGRVRRQPHADVTGERDDARARPHATGATLRAIASVTGPVTCSLTIP